MRKLKRPKTLTNKKALKLLACTVWELVENEGHSEWWLNFAFGLTQKETRYLLNKNYK